MGVGNGEPVTRADIYRSGSGSRAAAEGLQGAEPRKHGMGFCNGEAVGQEALRSIREGNGAQKNAYNP